MNRKRKPKRVYKERNNSREWSKWVVIYVRYCCENSILRKLILIRTHCWVNEFEACFILMESVADGYIAIWTHKRQRDLSMRLSLYTSLSISVHVSIYSIRSKKGVLVTVRVLRIGVTRTVTTIGWYSYKKSYTYIIYILRGQIQICKFEMIFILCSPL